MATVELYPDVEEVRVQLESERASHKSDDTDQREYRTNLATLERDRSHTAAVMDTDKSA